MKKILLLNLCLLLVATTQLFAQTHPVTGKVTAKEDGLPLPGVSVTVKGTTTGTQTDVSGKYSLNVPDGAQLTFSFLGYSTQTLTASGNTLNVVLVATSRQLGEVVVTGALGLTRTRNQQSYAAQQVSGDEVSKQRSSNFIGGLSGKVSGLDIRQNNTLGGSTNVIIRGVKSIYGNNQALFVIDGVPIDNTNTNNAHGTGLGGVLNTQNQGTGGYDYGTPAADINPDDIEDITVLKGAGATALYGSRGSNGVILITTKKAKKGLGIIVNSTITSNSADKSTLPKYQTQYGQGYSIQSGDGTRDGFTTAPGLFNDPNAIVAPTGDDASNGVAFNPNLKVYQWDAFVPGLANYGKATPWVAAKNNPNSFFINSLSTNNSIMVTNGGDNGSFKLGYTRSDDRDDVPGTYYIKNKVDFGATYNINSKLSVGADLNYTNQNGKTGEGTGYDGTNSDNRNVMTGFRQWWGLNNDIKELKEAYDLHPNLNTTWNMADPASGNTGPAYWNNPYFVVLHNYATATRNRYLGNVNATYKALPWLSFTGRISLDSYSDFDEERYDSGSIGVPYYSRYNKDFHETNFDLYANIDKNFGSDFSLKGLLGTNIRKDYLSSIEAETNNGLVIPGIYSLSNTVSSPLPATELQQKSEVDGVFADATLTWKKLFSVEGTIRRDVSSTLPEGHNAYWYPSVSGGFIFSELLKNLDWLSYGKIRGNYAEVGSDAPAYRVLDTYNISPPFDGNPVAIQNLLKNNVNLKPERTRSAEGGLELDFLRGRLHFDGSYYVTKTIDQLIPVNVSTATGYTSYFQNAGTVQNKGIELSISGTPVATPNFNWKITVNWSANRNKVLELYKDGSGNEAQDLLIAGFQNGESINAPLNQPFGIIKGTDYTYDSKGQKIVGPDGEYVINQSSNNNIGNTNAKWTGGINNQFTLFKNFHVSFLIDFRKGGDIFSNDLAYGLDDGLYQLTTYTNDLGNSVRAPLTNDSKSGGFIRPGVTATGAPNTVRVDGSAYGEWGNGAGLLPLKAFVYDGGFIKLREALIGYDLPSSVLGKLGPVKGVTFQLIGHNLWIIHKNIPYSDPEDGLSSGNIQGVQEGSYPTVRTIAFNLKLKF